jgi:hypothetical protein
VPDSLSFPCCCSTGPAAPPPGILAAAIVVPVVVVAAGVGLATWWLLRRKRNRRRGGQSGPKPRPSPESGLQGIVVHGDSRSTRDQDESQSADLFVEVSTCVACGLRSTIGVRGGTCKCEELLVACCVSSGVCSSFDILNIHWYTMTAVTLRKHIPCMRTVAASRCFGYDRVDCCL